MRQAGATATRAWRARTFVATSEGGLQVSRKALHASRAILERAAVHLLHHEAVELRESNLLLARDVGQHRAAARWVVGSVQTRALVDVHRDDRPREERAERARGDRIRQQAVRREQRR
jgi:hypothetical protein